MVDLPAPEEPTSAIVWLALLARVIDFNTLTSGRCGYEKLTFSNDLPNESYTLFNNLTFIISSKDSKILYSGRDDIITLTT